MRRLFALAILSFLAVLPVQCFASISVDTVPVANPWNAPDNRVMSTDYTSGYGSVGYEYRIGKYEITAAQYTEFLNKVAATDTYYLYNPNMWTLDYGCKIQRSGVSGSYMYSVASAWANRPVNCLSFWDACRFANWMHNGQPAGLQIASTTEDGAYTLNGYNDNDGRDIGRNPGAKWFLPSENEWYKAAYYDPGKPGGAGYWKYPTRTDTIPTNVLSSPDGGNTATCFGESGYTIGSPYYRTLIGEHENSYSAYGTFDQAGNVEEWNEAVVDPNQYYGYRGMRGGHYESWTDFQIGSPNRGCDFPLSELDFHGFRVANIQTGWQPVPEPSSFLALAGGVGMLFALRRRKTKS